ncbi:MAG: lysylphosphatidylglycerol synthase transmembrane domain-containing protein [Desulfatibacillaceae bacterium]
MAVATAAVTAALLASTGDVGQFLALFTRVDMRFVAAAILLLFSGITLRALRLASAMWRPSRVVEMIPLISLHQFIAFLLPSRLGELSLPVLLKRRYGTGYSQAAGLLMVVRLYDVLCVFAYAGITGFFVLEERLAFSARLAILAAGIGALCVMTGFPALHGRIHGRFFGNGRAPASTPGRLFGLLATLSEGMRFARGHHAGVWIPATSLAVWACVFGACWAAARAMGLSASVFETVLSGAAATFSGFLPVNTLAGVGTYETAWAVVILEFGADWDLALASGFLLHGLSILSTILYFGIAMSAHRVFRA